MPEGEEQVQEIENLFEKNSEEELAQSGKENKTSRSPGISKKSKEVPESPKEVGPKEAAWRGLKGRKKLGQL